MSETDQIHAVTARLAAAWAAGDATAYGAEFTEDADYVVFNGTHLKGRQAIVDTHRWLFDGPLKGSRIAGSASAPASVRFVRPDVAILITAGAVASGDAAPAPGQDSVQTTVFVKNGDQWRVASFQNTRKTA
ncbi:SgcJ/EcaC family oxidoreductase [Fodinicola acaciae]|uniref:SgcJ/EcaC family oxidoreductase n=1 Tax=Fodinicola acaciae TaxID=2681555 RepID=UPI0013D5701C|nr:SgcJ/EcaC family oxidoreductase [Fodinicola acaciae]